MKKLVPAFAVALLASSWAATGAHAAANADDPTVTAAFADTTVSATYGLAEQESGPWVFKVDVTGELDLKHFKLTSVDITGAPAGYQPDFYSFRTDEPSTTGLIFTGYIFPASDQRPLTVGTYTLTATFTDGDGTGDVTEVTPPATLTIAPAPVTVVSAVQPDPSNPANAIVTADLTGDFFGNWFAFSYEYGPVSPGGSWAITVSDSAGEVVHEYTATRQEGSQASGISSYWADVPPGEYTVRATFTPAGAAADRDFTFTQAEPVTFSAAPQPGATSTAQPAPPAPPPTAQSGTTLPAWIPLAAGILSAGLLALTIVQVVRLVRLRRAAPSASGVAA
jgi:hypothetical protein